LIDPAPRPATDIEALAKGGRTNVAGFFIRLIARIPFLIVGGQWYGAEALGRLAYAIVILEFSAQIATLGLKRGLALHLGGDGKDNGAWDGLVVIAAATLIPVTVIMIFPQIMFPNTAIRPLDYLLPVLIVPSIAATDVMLAALAYRFNVGATVTARAIVEPWTISIAGVALWWIIPDDALIIAYALSIGGALIAASIPFLRTYGLPRNWKPRPAALFALARRNVPLAAADAIEWGSRRIDILILGLFVSPATVGIYWVAQQIASLPQKLKTSFDPVLGPVITRKLAEGDKPAVARQISQVGFWILAAQAGVALSLGIPAQALLGLVGPGGSFVGGTAALALLLCAEVVASLAVVSEAAMVYIARHRNMLISLCMIAGQAVLSVGFVTVARAQGYGESWQAASVAAALVVALAIASAVKSRVVARLLDAPVSVWRWSILGAAAAAIIVGQIFIRLPEWVEIAFGIPAILGVYGWIIWTRGFREDDRTLFRKATG
jgi:O-antigen/teichoic acid export membrane protein